MLFVRYGNGWRETGHACVRFERGEPARLQGIPRLHTQRCTVLVRGPRGPLADGRGTRTARLVSPG